LLYVLLNLKIIAKTFFIC